MKTKLKLRHFFYVGCALTAVVGLVIVNAGGISDDAVLACAAIITALAWFIVRCRLGLC